MGLAGATGLVGTIGPQGGPKQTQLNSLSAVNVHGESMQKPHKKLLNNTDFNEFPSAAWQTQSKEAAPKSNFITLGAPADAWNFMKITTVQQLFASFWH